MTDEAPRIRRRRSGGFSTRSHERSAVVDAEWSELPEGSPAQQVEVHPAARGGGATATARQGLPAARQWRCVGCRAAGEVSVRLGPLTVALCHACHERAGVVAGFLRAVLGG